jgi:5-methylthioadenosine/S-adenosylhomocysteine deaminase
MKIGDGLAPVPDLLKAGINVGLGTDSIRANNNLDLFEEMKYAAIFQKGHRLDPTLMHASQVLEMATINGARALGLEKDIGSLEKGKKADIIIVNLNNLRLTPVMLGKYFNLVSNIVYSAHGDDVDTAIVDGEIVMENRKLKRIDDAKVVEVATKASEDLLERRKQFE